MSLGYDETCDEPWDTYHLWHDAIWETGLPEEEIKAWESLPQGEKLKPKWRTAFESVGYVFGRTVINVIRCPGCPKDAEPDPAKALLCSRSACYSGKAPVFSRNIRLHCEDTE